MSYREQMWEAERDCAAFLAELTAMLRLMPEQAETLALALKATQRAAMYAALAVIAEQAEK